ncbi:Uncharacterised protein [Mycobacteroides abscessus subsp. abscessus]|nr:Uncharacterised protein [Mycobacteroides abscessus subsp. abscessus]
MGQQIGHADLKLVGAGGVRERAGIGLVQHAGQRQRVTQRLGGQPICRHRIGGGAAAEPAEAPGQ